ncbi:hypothetical protein AVEN_115832-1 [Araneus ventricosus]|uniref:Uncharacterized protein n=1 Tax=Araneus ventricosus TaxID=182803 RepID=A0A4Y2S9K0_ARAVE|nr:hypothetical protein AVEN_115832-1 [Araneus ventricosus]
MIFTKPKFNQIPTFIKIFKLKFSNRKYDLVIDNEEGIWAGGLGLWHTQVLGRPDESLSPRLEHFYGSLFQSSPTYSAGIYLAICEVSKLIADSTLQLAFLRDQQGVIYWSFSAGFLDILSATPSPRQGRVIRNSLLVAYWAIQRAAYTAR